MAKLDPKAKMRSLLFVPGDRPDRFPKAAASGADALILDLEDSVAPDAKAGAREAVARYLTEARPVPCFVRVNPLESGLIGDDLEAVLETLDRPGPDGLVLPKAEGPAAVEALVALAQEKRPGIQAVPPILALAGETPAGVFTLGNYGEVADRLFGLTWGAEDLPAAVGATSARESDGSFTDPYKIVRTLTLFGAHAAGLAAIETVYPDIANADGLAAYVARARRDGFTGMMAIHPSQVAAINAGFTPTDEEVAKARAIVAAFEANPGAGVLRLEGKMIDRPHLKQAERVLARL